MLRVGGPGLLGRGWREGQVLVGEGFRREGTVELKLVAFRGNV